MENQLQVQNNQLTNAQQQSGGLRKLSEKEIALGQQVFHVNQVAKFPLDAEQIMDWAQSINEITPEMTPEQLHEVIRQYKSGELEYDRGQGIQNIFEGYRAIYGKRGLVY